MKKSGNKLAACLIFFASGYFLLMLNLQGLLPVAIGCFAAAQIFSFRHRQRRLFRAVVYGALFIFLSIFMLYHHPAWGKSLHFSAWIKFFIVIAWLGETALEFRCWRVYGKSNDAA